MNSITVLLAIQFFIGAWSASLPRSSSHSDVSNAKMLAEVVAIISGSRRASIPPSGVATVTGSRCQVKEISTCFSTALRKFHNSLSNIDKMETRWTVCGIADQFEECTTPHKTNCSFREKLTFDTIIKGAKYLCTKEGFNNYLALAPCLSNSHVVNKLKSCSPRMAKLPHRVNHCQLLSNYTACTTEATRTTCSPGVQNIMKEAITIILSPLKEAVCPISTSRFNSHIPVNNNLMPKQTHIFRFRREAPEGGMGGLFGGGEPTEGSPSEIFWGPRRSQAAAFPGYSLGWAQGLSPEFSLDFQPSDMFQNGGGQGGNSEEVSTFSPYGFPQFGSTQEPNSEEQVTFGAGLTTPEPSSEEVSTLPPDVTTPEGSSEEVSTVAPEVTTPEDSSEEETTVPTNGTTLEPSSEEVSTLAPDATTPEDSSEEETTLPTNSTTPGDSSEEETTIATNGTTAEPSSDEVTSPTIISTTQVAPIVIVPTEAPTTTTEAGHLVPPFQCYECHSGAPGSWQNSQCQVNGKIDEWAAIGSVCYGQCVSMITRYPKGEVYRACATNYYFPFVPPYDGCIRHNQELYCFCSGDYCNNRDMTADQQNYILQATPTVNTGTNTNIGGK